MLQQCFNLLRGCVEIDIRGAAIERFLNLCAIHGVQFWGVDTLEPDHFTAWVSVRGYFALHPYARKTGCRLRVFCKRGIPFAANRAVRRRSLWIGLLCTAAAVWLLSGLVWTIEIRGEQEVSERELLQLLEIEGLRTGARRQKLNARRIRSDILSREERLAYLTINFSGTRAIIDVWERKNMEEGPKRKLPGDCLSEVTGVVLRTRVRTGNASVKPGDTVQAGERIASGTLLREGFEPMLVCAEAEADVRTWYTLRAAVPKELSLLERNGRSRKSLILTLGRRSFPVLRIEKQNFPWYDKRVENRDLRLHEYFRWPMCLRTEILCPGRLAPINLRPKALEEALEQRLLEQLKRTKPEAELVQSSFSMEKTPKGAYMGTLRVEMIETTGKQVPYN